MNCFGQVHDGQSHVNMIDDAHIHTSADLLILSDQITRGDSLRIKNMDLMKYVA